MNKTRDNHYVPEWYQRGFLFDEKNGKLRYLDFEPHRIRLPGGTTKEIVTPRAKSPSQCFFQTDLYTTFLGSYVNDEIERFLFGNIDTKGSRAVRAFIGNNPSEWHHCFLDFFAYIDAQKIRTPKGLHWIQEHYPQLDQLALMIEMQAIRTMNCTLWVEGVREIISAKNCETKFIISDHPVTLYNPAYPPNSAICSYPNDPSIALKGTQTIFPLDKDHCLVLTNYEYAKAPDTEKPTEKRTNARNFRPSLVRTDAFIKSRELNNKEVLQINYLLKSRARRFIAAAKEEWLYPERRINPTWTEISRVLLPRGEDLWQFGGEIYAGYEGGKTRYQDAFGRTQPENKYLKKPRADVIRGRNDPCGCGSGRKYKRCCLNKPPSQRTTWEELSIRERNLILRNGIYKILGLADGKTWDDVRRELSSQHVKELYELYGSLWPLDTDAFKLLPKPDGSLRALYTGVIDPRTIGRSVTSLVPYFDEILAQTPFINPWSVKKEFSPIDSPHQFKAQTLKDVALFLSLIPFVEAGYLNLFPDACAFDRHLLEQMFNMAEGRSQSLAISGRDKRLMEQLQKDDFERTMWMLPKEAQKHRIKRAVPHITDNELEETLAYFAARRQPDQLSLLQDDLISSDKGGQLLVPKMSPNFEMSLYVAQATGSLIVTDSQTRWGEIMEAQNRTDGVVKYPWNSLTEFIKGKEMLLSGDQAESFEWRQSGKLRDVRNSMKNIYNAATTVAPDRNAVDRQRDEFERSWLAKSTRIDGTRSSFKATFECVIPEGGFIHNNVQRLLLTSGVENHTDSVPIAILINETA